MVQIQFFSFFVLLLSFSSKFSSEMFRHRFLPKKTLAIPCKKRAVVVTIINETLHDLHLRSTIGLAKQPEARGLHLVQQCRSTYLVPYDLIM